MSKYTLSKPRKEAQDCFMVTIVADSNDADYITTTQTYSSKEFNGVIVDELIQLKNNYSGSHQLEDCPLGEYIDIPFNGYDGFCHSLESLTITYVDEDGYTWDVNLRGDV
ncbi:hypothetical protein IAQ67_15925 [Paenibacillus peoriae]|uniref:Uncharacterized protein n=1 Tax=Paenibacillus peoriae TaxID=59893 RepID=A0A7H0Y2S3_9BACL|nr:hypothetical protein [Paenibacillus peoriae]QNR65381.1 hypothetical protein IAQ67_15925 [Paenibacillus peoriae]